MSSSLFLRRNNFEISTYDSLQGIMLNIIR